MYKIYYWNDVRCASQFSSGGAETIGSSYLLFQPLINAHVVELGRQKIDLISETQPCPRAKRPSSHPPAAVRIQKPDGYHLRPCLLINLEHDTNSQLTGEGSRL